MAHQVFKYHPTESGEYVTGLPQGPITDEWLAAEATARGLTVDVLSAEIAAYRRADGKPLYTATARGRDELGEAVVPPELPIKPKVPLGQVHPKAGD